MKRAAVAFGIVAGLLLGAAPSYANPEWTAPEFEKNVRKLAVGSGKAKVFCVCREASTLMGTYAGWLVSRGQSASDGRSVVQVYCRVPRFAAASPYEQEVFGMCFDFLVLSK